MNNAMIYILLIAALISFMALIETVTTNFILCSNGVGTMQELKADKALEALEKLGAPTTIVRRNGELQEIKASELFLATLLFLKQAELFPPIYD